MKATSECPICGEEVDLPLRAPVVAPDGRSVTFDGDLSEMRAHLARCLAEPTNEGGE